MSTNYNSYINYNGYSQSSQYHQFQQPTYQRLDEWGGGALTPIYSTPDLNTYNNLPSQNYQELNSYIYHSPSRYFVKELKLEKTVKKTPELKQTLLKVNALAQRFNFMEAFNLTPREAYARNLQLQIAEECFRCKFNMSDLGLFNCPPEAQSARLSKIHEFTEMGKEIITRIVEFHYHESDPSRNIAMSYINSGNFEIALVILKTFPKAVF